MQEMLDSIKEEVRARGYQDVTDTDAKRIYDGMVNNECVQECFGQRVDITMEEKR